MRLGVVPYRYCKNMYPVPVPVPTSQSGIPNGNGIIAATNERTNERTLEKYKYGTGQASIIIYREKFR